MIQRVERIKLKALTNRLSLKQRQAFGIEYSKNAKFLSKISFCQIALNPNRYAALQFKIKGNSLEDLIGHFISFKFSKKLHSRGVLELQGF
jgi:hypothetical protein